MNYGLSTDLANTSDGRLYSHSLGYGGSFKALGDFRAIFGIGASYSSIENEVIQDYTGVVHLSDARIGVSSKNYKFYSSSTRSILGRGSLTNVVPLSERSRRDGYLSIPSLSMGSSYRQGRFNISIRGQGSKVINTYRESIVGIANRESSITGGLSIGYNFKYFYAQYGYRAGVSNLTDGSSFGRSGNSLSLSTILWKDVAISLSTGNVNFIEEQFVDLWFYSPYTRVYSLGIGIPL